MPGIYRVARTVRSETSQLVQIAYVSIEKPIEALKRAAMTIKSEAKMRPGPPNNDMSDFPSTYRQQ
jgi:hypothetical protein